MENINLKEFKSLSQKSWLGCVCVLGGGEGGPLQDSPNHTLFESLLYCHLYEIDMNPPIPTTHELKYREW